MNLHDYVKTRAPQGRVDAPPSSGALSSGAESSGAESSGEAHKMSRTAYGASAATPIKKHVEAHRMAGNLHKDAAAAHKEAGNSGAAEKHEEMCKEHMDCADKMEKDFSNTHLYE